MWWDIKYVKGYTQQPITYTADSLPVVGPALDIEASLSVHTVLEYQSEQNLHGTLHEFLYIFALYKHRQADSTFKVHV